MIIFEILLWNIVEIFIRYFLDISDKQSYQNYLDKMRLFP